jgi:hypothetical protein
MQLLRLKMMSDLNRLIDSNAWMWGFPLCLILLALVVLPRQSLPKRLFGLCVHSIISGVAQQFKSKPNYESSQAFLYLNIMLITVLSCSTIASILSLYLWLTK